MVTAVKRRRMMRSARRVRQRTRRWDSAGNRPISLRRSSIGTGNYNVFRVTRTADYGYLDTHASDPVLGAKSFKLSDLPGYTDITGFFDQYRIALVKVIFIPNTPVEYWQGATGKETLTPNLLTVIDNDDDTTPGSSAILQQYDTLHHHGNCTNGKWVRYIRPTVNIATEVTAGALTGLSNKQDQWIDTQSTGVKHYGIKYSIEGQGVNANAGPAVRMYATFYIEARKAL